MNTAILISVLAVIGPPLFLWITYLGFKRITRRNTSAMRLAADISVIVFMFSCYYLIQIIWELYTGWWMIIITLVIAASITTLHWKVIEEVELKRILKHAWRFHFLMYTALYIVLLVTGFIGLFI